MKYLFSAIALLISFSIALANPAIQDSMGKPSIKYTKNELKKEEQDGKNFDKQIKEWNKAIQKPNIDYLNSLFGKIMATLYKEHNELSNRISDRSRKLVPPTPKNAADSLALEEKPKAYNPELKEKLPRTTKEEVLQKKVESEYLSKYVVVVRQEKSLLQKLKNVPQFNFETQAAVYQEISKDLEQFRSQIKAEVALMKAETGKK